MDSSDSAQFKRRTFSNLAASSIAALISRLCTHPLDTVKTRIQVSNKPLPLLPTFLQLLKTGGLYRGLPIALTLSVPGLSVYLTTYDVSKQWISSRFPYYGAESVYNHLASAAIAETFSGLFWTPMEVLKSKQQVENITLTPTKPGHSIVKSAGTYRSFSLSTITPEFLKTQTSKTLSQVPISTLKLAREIYRHEGILGFYRGYFITLGVFVPYSMMYFATYEKLKELARQRRYVKTSVKSDVPLPFLTTASCAAFATGVAGGVSNIVDVVKTRWQVSVLAATEENSSTGKIVSNMFRRGGVASFTRGMGARILWMIPSVTISMSTYEWLKQATL